MNNLFSFQKCAAFCRPYVEHKGYVGFGHALDCFLEANCNRCSCYFDAGFLPDTDFDEWAAEANNVVGPVNGAIGLPGSNDKCYPYKVSLLCNRSIIDSRRSLYNVYSLFTYTQYYSEHGNPYDPDDNGRFELPIDIREDAHDEYGQITGQHLIAKI